MYGWWRFFQKPVGLELVFFVNPELIFATFFFIFFFDSDSRCDYYASLFLMEHGFNGLAKAKRGFAQILIASLLFDFHGFILSTEFVF